MENKPRSIHLFKGLQRLVPSEFESKLYNLNKKHSFLSEKGWSQDALDNGLFIDLSQVRWAEMSAAGQLVLLIESAKSSSIQVTIAFPLNDLTKNEKEHLKRLESTDPTKFNKDRALFHNLKNLRIKTLDYLKVINFESAVDCEHVKVGTITKVFDYNVDSESPSTTEKATKIIVGGEHSAETEHETNYDYKLIIPLTWINSKNQTKNLENFSELFNRIVSQSRRGLDAVDAQAINNVIISELTKNVSEHSDREFGLIGTALQPTSALTRRTTDGRLSFSDFNVVERDYIEWTALNNNYYVAIFFGDCGNGIVKKLEGAYSVHANQSPSKPDEVLKWSFNKWSTSKSELETRQTKGLYRIHRIANKYSGMIMIRTKNILGGFQRGGMDEPTWVLNNATEKKTELSFIPGTILKMYFTPYKELLKINTQQSTRKSTQSPSFEWVSKSIELVHESPEKTFTGNLSLKKIFSSDSKNLLLTINLPKTKKNEVGVDDVIIDLLKFLSLGRHPNGVLVYIGHEDWDTVEAKLDSLNQLIFDHKIKPNAESSHPNTEEIYDPILVLGKGAQYAWVGDNRNIISVLNELYEEKTGRKKLEDLGSFLGLDSDEQTKILQFVCNDNAIISLTDEQELRINFGDVVSYYSNSLRRKVEQLKSTADTKKIYLTPNLRYIDWWVDIKKVIADDTVGFALALFLLYSQKIRDQTRKLDSRLKILITNSNDKELAYQFALLVGVQSNNVINLSDEIDGRLPRRNPIFEESDEVIILTTIISTAETIRRSIKAVQRDLANPVVVIGLINQSDAENSEITTWGTSVPVVTLVEGSMIEISDESVLEHKKRGLIEYISPLPSKQIGITYDMDAETNEQILDLIESTKSLHFDHLGKANGRHFTFYLSPNMLLSNEAKYNELIVEKFCVTIDAWLTEKNVVDFEVWRPTLDFKYNDPLDKITDSVATFYQKRNEIKLKRISKIKRTALYGEWSLISEPAHGANRSDNIVILDWGILTGSTIQQMVNLAITHEKSNILICVLFSQISRKESLFYRNLNEVRVTKSDGTLFPSREQESASLSVSLLYEFPLRYYESFDCPVCEHIRALADYEIKGQHMGEFSLKRRKRLKIKDKSIAEGSMPPQDFYSDFVDNLSELDSTVIMKMFKLRILLQDALDSTQKRNEVLEQLEFVVANIETEKIKSNSDLYAFLYFLSVEIMWLQKPPLVFKKLRTLISKVALYVASWDTEEMEGHFASDIKMVIRYKFAAISVLRSSHKLLFCENIYPIFISAKKGGHYSHNVTQNLFYHTHSLLLKEYHKSTKYFTNTIENLNKIIAIVEVGPQIIFVAQYLRNLAQKKKYLIQLEGKSKVELVKSLKKEIENYYGTTPHSEIFDLFRSMTIESVREPIKRLDINDSEYKSNLVKIQDWASELVPKWGQASGYFEAVVNNHLYKLYDLYESKFFRNLRIHEYFPVNENSVFVGYDDEFTKIVYNISKSPLESKIYLESYRENYSRLYKGVFSSTNLNQPIDSKIIILSNQFPTDINLSIDKCIKKFTARFHNPPKINFVQSDAFKIFYPKIGFDFAINQILGNVERHCIQGTKIADAEITLTVSKYSDPKGEDEFIILKVLNTGTVGKENSENGALSQIKNELNIFGGDCEWKEGTNNFAVTLNFLNYGD